MFERRVKTVLVFLLIALLGIAARLVDLQIIHADEYREQAANALLLAPRDLPFVRGSILDRTGVLLASDEPSWDLKIDYGVLAEDPPYLAARVSRLVRSGRYGDGLDEAAVGRALAGEINEMWAKLACFSGEGVCALRQEAFEVCERIARVRRAVAGRRGFDAPVAEERMAHAIVGGLDSRRQIAARTEFKRYPWVKIEAVTHRRYHQAECLAHVLGQLGPVDARHIKNDPHAGDELRSYQGNERIGVSGVEFAGEGLLRGWRGRLRRNRKGETLQDVRPQAGRDVHLTVRHDLQQRLYDLLASALPGLPYSSGGSIVVLDVPSRDVLALVSYPAYDPNRFRGREVYDRLRRDAVKMPLRFRAVSNRYPPGSLVKPLTCLAGLSTGAISLETRINCAGSLYPDRPDMPGTRCWQIAGTERRKAHGSIAVVEALEGSCNVFMYTVGLAVGADTLTSFFDMVGFGRPCGTGLREEALGINPTPDWLATVRGDGPSPSDARQFSIGQGEVAATPLQVANLMATYAAGVYKPVRLIREGPEQPTWELPVSPIHWRAIREGLFKVVNSPHGTAYKYARFIDDGYALCGKTGTATAMPRPTSFQVSYVSESGIESSVIVAAGSRGEAIDEFERLHPEATFDPKRIRKHGEWPRLPPPGGGRHAHAWFAGYLQRLDGAGRPMYEVQPRIAFAVLVEYGGSGGRTSGPIARQVAGIIVDALGDDLSPDAGAPIPGASP